MKYDFDKGIDRRGTSCVKWDMNKIRFGREDLLSMWVADMDFEVPPCVTEAILKRASHHAYGYTFYPESLYEAIMEWEENRHGWKIFKESLAFVSGIVPAINFLIDCFTEKGDGIVIQTPVYPPFIESVLNQNRKLLTSPFVRKNGSYEIDFEDLESKLSGAKMLILSNPHNPLGRCYRRDELDKIGQLCIRHGVILISDEIHQDIVFTETKHVCTASISKEISDITITLIAQSKTFNIPGLGMSAAVIENKEFRDKFVWYLRNKVHNQVNIFGITAGEAAYRCGGDWLDQLLVYLQANRDFALDFIGRKIPSVRAVKPDSTYLMWLDFTDLGLKHKELENHIVEKAGVGLFSGILFGDEGEGYMRLNFACPKSNLKNGLTAISNALS